MKKTYFAPETLCVTVETSEQILTLSIVEGNANPDNDVLAPEDDNDDLW